MEQIPIFVINLARRPDRLKRIGEHLDARGVEWSRVDACDASRVDPEQLDQVIAPSGPLGALGLGDRACTVSHCFAWRSFLNSSARYALFLEDDVYLAAYLASLLQNEAWVPPGVHVIKLEKFGAGRSRVLLGPASATLPGTARSLHRMYSRHVGGGAYILSRIGAEMALAECGRMRVPIDHLLFNDTVSPVFHQLRPMILRPAMATQRYYVYNSDIAKYGKAARPKGWRLRLRHLQRGLREVSQAHRQLFALATGRARILELEWQDVSATEGPLKSDSVAPP